MRRRKVLSVSSPEFDTSVRLAAFQFLGDQVQIHGETLPRRILEQGFIFSGGRIPLISPQGIFTPRGLEYPLSCCTAPPSMRHPPPYADELAEDGTIHYRYRGTDPNHRDNVGLRRAMEDGIPLVYLYGIVPGEYSPVWPVYVIGDDPRHLTFNMTADDVTAQPKDKLVLRESAADGRRQYVTAITQRRLHQAGFRRRVLRAYQERCAICVLRHVELLEAAHILPDTHPDGKPLISNGVSLCKLHHAAFDSNILGIDPDCQIHVRQDVLREHDGPMLRHGLQGIEGQQLHVPRVHEYKPNPSALGIRFEEFLRSN
jgi:putative restriction endonuclease